MPVPRKHVKEWSLFYLLYQCKSANNLNVCPGKKGKCMVIPEKGKRTAVLNEWTTASGIKQGETLRINVEKRSCLLKGLCSVELLMKNFTWWNNTMHYIRGTQKCIHGKCRGFEGSVLELWWPLRNEGRELSWRIS